MGTVTFGKLLPGKVEAVHWSYSVSFFFPPQSAFRKLLPQQKRFAARSSEWLNNSGESDFSRTSLGLCLWSNTTQGLDTLKTLLRIWLCTQKRLVKKWLCRRRQWMMALVFTPKHLTFAVKSCSPWRQPMKKPWNSLKVSQLDIFFWRYWVYHSLCWLHCDRHFKTEMLKCTFRIYWSKLVITR